MVKKILSEEEHAFIAADWVQEALDSMRPDRSKTSREDAVEHLMVAIRHYCRLHNLDYDEHNRASANYFAMDVLNDEDRKN